MRNSTGRRHVSGFYVKGQILPGRYEVQAELRGFKSKGQALLDARFLCFNTTLACGRQRRGR